MALGELLIIFLIGVKPLFLKKLNIKLSSHLLKMMKYFFLISSLVYIFYQYKSLRNVEGASILLATLFILKLWEGKTKRDTFLFLLIGLLFMTSKFLLHQSPILLFYLLLMSFFFLVLTTLTSPKSSIGEESKELKKARFSSIGNVFLISIPLATFLFFVLSKSSTSPSLWWTKNSHCRNRF